MSALFGFSPGSIRAEEFRAGVATVDITPPAGFRMSGYFSERLSTGTHDPLMAKAMYFRQGDTEAVLVFCDLIGLSLDVSQAVRREAESATTIPREYIMIAATHSHTGPLYFGAMREQFRARAVAADGRDKTDPGAYRDELVGKLVQAIAEAKANLRPVAIRAGAAEQQGLSFNRRFHMKNGGVRFNPGKLNPDIVRPAGPIDPEIGLLVLDDPKTGKPRAALTTFALHLDTVGGTEYSGDYPYYLSRDLQKKYGDSFISMFAAGTCGDINHIDVSHDRPQKGHGEAERIGTTLAQTVMARISELPNVKSPSLAVDSATVDAPLQKYSVERIAQARRDINRIGDRSLPFLDTVEAHKIVALQWRGGETIPLLVQVFRFSDEVALVGLPGEVFVDLGLAIKRGSPFATTIVVELTNDAPGYIPTKKAFAEGSYETVNSRIQPGGGEKLVAAAVELLKDLKRSRP